MKLASDNGPAYEPSRRIEPARGVSAGLRLMARSIVFALSNLVLDERTRYLSGASDHVDLERRERAWDVHQRRRINDLHQ